LYSVCGNSMMQVVDIASWKVVASVKTGAGTDAAGFDPVTGFSFASNGQDGTLSVAKESSPDAYTVVQNIPTLKSARTMALDPATHTVYLSAAKFGPMPEKTADNPNPRPKMVPGSFTIIVIELK